MTGNCPFGDEERGGDLPVRAAFCDQGGDAALGGCQPLLARPPADAPELAARPFDPGRGSEMLEAVERGLDRLAGGPRVPRATPHDSKREQCPSLAERVADLLVLCNRPIEEGTGAIDLTLGGGDKATTAGCVRRHPHAADPSRVDLPRVE